MYIICGDNIPESSKRVEEIIQTKISAGQKIVRLDANNLKVENLRQELSPADLFGNSNFICLSGLLSANKKKSQTQIIDFLKKSDQSNLLLYETKAVHPATIKQFKNAQIENFKVSIDIFKFLEKLYPNQASQLLHQYQELVSKGAEPEYLFAMILRQVRLLISIRSSSSSLKLPQFALSKLRQQSQAYTLEKLLEKHKELYSIEANIKTGKTSADMTTLLENFLINL